LSAPEDTLTPQEGVRSSYVRTTNGWTTLSELTSQHEECTIDSVLWVKVNVL
jgi:hypothetical protein